MGSVLNGHSWGHPGHCFRLYLQTPSLCSEQGRVKVGQLHLHPTFPQALSGPRPAPGMWQVVGSPT